MWKRLDLIYILKMKTDNGYHICVWTGSGGMVMVGMMGVLKGLWIPQEGQLYRPVMQYIYINIKVK